MKKSELREHLTEKIIPFWNKLRDDENGGFYGFADENGAPDKNYVKGGILNSRILWFYSSAYSLLGEKELLENARAAFSFMEEALLDKENGGVYWSVNPDKTPADDIKHTYNQAFAVYALSAYYMASGDEKALSLAFGLQDIIETKCRDKDGYLEAFGRDFSPASNEKLSENGVMASRTMNTLLHVMEAYSELYRAKKTEKTEALLREILNIFKTKVYDGERKIFKVFFDMNYNTLIDLESYGHDIESSWLVSRACEVIGDEKLTSKMLPIIKGLAEGAFEHGIDKEAGALNNECENGKDDVQKIWWVQAEAVTGFYNAYKLFPEKTEFLEISEKIWEFIKNYVVDPKTGEWFETVPKDGKNPDLHQPLVHLWKCPYHNGRMFIEMINRLEE